MSELKSKEFHPHYEVFSCEGELVAQTLTLTDAQTITRSWLGGYYEPVKDLAPARAPEQSDVILEDLLVRVLSRQEELEALETRVRRFDSEIYSVAQTKLNEVQRKRLAAMKELQRLDLETLKAWGI